MHGVEQGRIFTRMPCRSHPVGGKLDLSNMLNPRGRNVGDRIAYRAVYLKAHHPAVYLTAFLASDTGYYERRVYVEEARRLGVPILGPDVNLSSAAYTTATASSRRNVISLVP